ncbi:MAG: methionine aminopeptidase [Leucobacter sp.]
MTKRDWGIDDPEDTYWYNILTKQVEEGPQSLAKDRIGPFNSRAEAERAPEIVAERAKQWAAEDAAEDE